MARFQIETGKLSPEKFMTRTFNRKMKMSDTFTRILPSYNHIDKTCYTKAASHDFHCNFEKSLEGIPMP